MICKFRILLLLSCSALAFSDQSDKNTTVEEQCIFDQDEQQKVYLELEEQYEGSEYVEEEYALLIPRNGDLIRLRRGGCVHFGVSIEFETPATTRFEDKDHFFAKVMELVTEFDQGANRSNKTGRVNSGRTLAQKPNGQGCILFVRLSGRFGIRGFS